MKKAITLVCAMLLSANIMAQNETLNNQSILDMIGLGFGDDIIIAKIQSADVHFNTSIDELKALKSKNVSADIIVAMISAEKELRDQQNESDRTDSLYRIKN